MNRKLLFLVLIFLILISCLILLLVGPVNISIFDLVNEVLGSSNKGVKADIIWKFRIPKMIAAIFAGANLSIAGLLMQTYFRNPLAGPFVLGVHSGASLGVAIWLMASQSLIVLIPWAAYIGIPIASFMGSFLILLMLMYLSTKVSAKVLILVLGLLFGYFSSGVINILIATSSAEDIKLFLLWNLGSYSRVVGQDLIIFIVVSTFGLLFAVTLIKKLNILLLGDDYAKTLGVSLKKLTAMIILVTAVLTGITTAYLGPIAFVGIIAPHLARFIFGSGDHKVLFPATALVGILISTIVELTLSSLTEFTIPLNAMMGIVGAPIVFVVLWYRRKGAVL